MGQGFTAVTQYSSSDGQVSPFSYNLSTAQMLPGDEEGMNDSANAVTKRHLLPWVDFPTGFLNSRATLTLPTLRKAPDFQGEALRITGAHEWPCCDRPKVLPSPAVLSPAMAVRIC